MTAEIHELMPAKEIAHLSERVFGLVAPELRGLDPRVQGTILADLTAMWLAGHLVPGDKAASKKLRDELLEMHIAMVRQLVAPNAALIEIWRNDIEKEKGPQ